MTGTTGDGPDLAEVFRRVRELMRRRRREFWAVSLATFVVVQAVAFFWPGTFAAHAAVLIQKTRMTAALDADPTDATTVISEGVTERDVNSEIAILTSAEVLSATVAATGLDRVPPPWYLRLLFAPLRAYEFLYAGVHGVPAPSAAERALRGLAKSISAERLKDSNVLVLTLEARNPEAAEAILGELVRQYLDRHVAIHGPGLGVVPFFSAQASVLEKELAQHEDALQALKRRAGAVDVSKEREIQLQSEAKLREESDLLGRRLLELDGRIRSYQSAVSDALSSPSSAAAIAPAEPTLNELKAQALRLELDQIRLEARYRDDAPPVVENRKKLEAARAALGAEKQSVRSASRALLAAEEERVRFAVPRGPGSWSGSGSSRSSSPSPAPGSGSSTRTAVEATRRQRLIRSAEERYSWYLGRGEKARIDSALDQRHVTNVSIVQKPSASAKPVRPKRLVTPVVSVAGALLAGLLACVIRELRERGPRRSSHRSPRRPWRRERREPGSGRGEVVPRRGGSRRRPARRRRTAEVSPSQSRPLRCEPDRRAPARPRPPARLLPPRPRMEDRGADQRPPRAQGLRRPGPRAGSAAAHVSDGLSRRRARG